MDEATKDVLLLLVLQKVITSIVHKANTVQSNLDEFISIQLLTYSPAQVAELIFGGQILLVTNEIDSFRRFGKTAYTSLINMAWGDGLNIRMLVEQKTNKDKLYKWRTESNKVCPDCEVRGTYEAQSLKEWSLIGLPRQGVTICGSNCRCILDSTADGPISE